MYNKFMLFAAPSRRRVRPTSVAWRGASLAGADGADGAHALRGTETDGFERGGWRKWKELR